MNHRQILVLGGARLMAVPEGKEADLDGGEGIADFMGDARGENPQGRQLLLALDDGAALAQRRTQRHNQAAINQNNHPRTAEHQPQKRQKEEPLQAGQGRIGLGPKTLPRRSVRGQQPGRFRPVQLRPQSTDLPPGGPLDPHQRGRGQDGGQHQLRKAKRHLSTHGFRPRQYNGCSPPGEAKSAPRPAGGGAPGPAAGIVM